MKIAKKIREITAQHKTIFSVNDYVDIALLSGADGAHLGQEDIPITEARKITPPRFIIGISTHSLKQAHQAERDGADYIGIGPVFSTPTKETAKPIGITTLKEITNKIHIPTVAIGGISLKNLALVKNAGIQSVAMVREFQTNTSEIVRRVNHLLLNKD